MADGKTFTDEEIAEIMKLLDATRRTQYVGARYVPIFGRKGETSIEWDGTAPYEPLTIVLYQGNSYTSRRHVPAGVEITNGQYWAETGNYNAQVEQYRQEVLAFDQRITNAQTDATTAINFDQRITDAQTDATTAINKATTNEGNITTNTNDITTINNNLNGLDTKINKLTNVVMAGVDNTGTEDVSDLLNTLARNAQYGLYFPAGMYKITKTIEFPYNTKQAYGITLDNGATIMAYANMDVMFSLGAYSRGDGIITEGFSISGGQFNAMDNANTCIKTSVNIRQSMITNVDLRYFNGIGLYIDSDPNESSDTIVSNIRIGRVQSPHHKPLTKGVYFAGNDNQLSCAYICDNSVNIETNGLLQITNVHVFNDKTWYNNNIRTYGIISWNGLNADNLYIDSIDYPITCNNRCILTNVYFYNYFATNYTRPYIRAVDNQLSARNINVGGVHSDNDIVLQIVDFDENKEITESKQPTCLFDIDTYLYINKKGIEDRNNFRGGNRSTQEIQINEEQYGTFQANSAIILGYIGLSNDGSSSVTKFSAYSANGYDFDCEGLITYYKNATPTNRVKISTFAMKEWCAPNWGIALGTPETVSAYGTTIQVEPIYLYARKTTTRMPKVMLRMNYTRSKGAYAYYSGDTPVIQLTNDNTIATLNEGGAL